MLLVAASLPNAFDGQGDFGMGAEFDQAELADLRTCAAAARAACRDSRRRRRWPGNRGRSAPCHPWPSTPTVVKGARRLRRGQRPHGPLGNGSRVGNGLDVFRSESDLLQSRLGPARLSHPEEYAQIMNELKTAGVEIDWRAGNLAYSPTKGGAGRIVLDPDASIGALRHEFQPFKDIQSAGYPGGMGYWIGWPREFARIEVRGYLQEISMARATGNADLIPSIVKQMKDRVPYLKQLEGW